jgi:hypothetical protein
VPTPKDLPKTLFKTVSIILVLGRRRTGGYTEVVTVEIVPEQPILVVAVLGWDDLVVPFFVTS